MSEATLNYSRVARQMLMQDATAARTAEACAAATSSVHQRLHHRLAPLIGVAGMRALFARSVKVTCAEFPQLAELRSADLRNGANVAESLVGLLNSLEYSAALDAATAIYANFLSLTSALMGERLVWLVLQRAFPEIDVSAQQESE